MRTDTSIDFRALFDAGSAPMLVLDRQFVIVEANAAYLRATARSREALIGHYVFDAFPDNPLDPAAKGVAALRASLERVLERRERDCMPILRYDVARPAEAGGGFEQRYWKPVNSPLLDARGKVACIVHHVEDVTAAVLEASAAQSEAHEQLQRQFAELQAVIESAPEAIYIGTAGGITRCNQHALDQLGFDSLEDLKQNVARLSEIIQNRDPATGEHVLPEELPFVRALHGERAVRDTEVIHLKTGEKRLIRGAASPIYVDGKVVGAVAINTDVTAERDRERHLFEAHRRIEEALSSANAERHVRERSIATLSHDLRTPLSVARVSAEILKLKADDPVLVRQTAMRIADNMERADRMIRDLLDADRASAGDKLAACDLAEVATAVLRELALIHGDRFELRGDANVIGYWSRSGIQRVLENLCSNAAKYGAAGSKVAVCLETREIYARVEVHNEGEPISEADLSSLFVPYWRSAPGRRAEQSGWGIGLTLVRGIVEAHGGTVSVESAAGRGTTFRVVLPLDARAARS